jgi:hypothetical protein
MSGAAELQTGGMALSNVGCFQRRSPAYRLVRTLYSSALL